MPEGFSPTIAATSTSQSAGFASSLKLAMATLEAHNSETVGKVLDESLARSAAARKQREADEVERRAEEARANRAYQARQAEAVSARQLTEQHDADRNRAEEQAAQARDMQRQALADRAAKAATWWARPTISAEG